MCSLVWGITPSSADTRRMAPSIWLVPEIMFLIKSACPKSNLSVTLRAKTMGLVLAITWTVCMGIRSCLRLISNVGNINGDSTGLLFRCLVDLVIRKKFRFVLGGQNLGDSCSQCRFPMINMAYRSNIDIWFGFTSLKIEWTKSLKRT